MAEPASGAAAVGFAGLKALTFVSAIAAGLAAIVAMCAMTPRHPREWAIGLISTVVCSVGGGATIISYYKLQEWAQEPFGLAGIGGLMFACGLPGWALVRWTFTYIERRSDKDLVEVVNEIKAVAQKQQS